jgi:hypothetical protein
MEYTTDGDAVFADDAAAAPPQGFLEVEEVARKVRVASCGLVSELRAAQDSPHEVDATTLRRWADAAADVNSGILKYARLATQRASRANLEAVMMENAMFSDVLDREATHVHTLQSLTRLADGPGVDIATGAVARALRVVRQLHTGTAPLTSDLPLSYFNADTCLDEVEAAAAVAT